MDKNRVVKVIKKNISNEHLWNNDNIKGNIQIYLAPLSTQYIIL